MYNPFLCTANSSFAVFLFLSFSLHLSSLFLCLCLCSFLSLSEHASQWEWISQHRQRPRGRCGGWDLLYPASVSTSCSLTHTPLLLPLFLSSLSHLVPIPRMNSVLHLLCINPSFVSHGISGSACLYPSLISLRQNSVSSSSLRSREIYALTFVRGEQRTVTVGCHHTTNWRSFDGENLGGSDLSTVASNMPYTFM